MKKLFEGSKEVGSANSVKKKVKVRMVPSKN